MGGQHSLYALIAMNAQIMRMVHKFIQENGKITLRQGEPSDKREVSKSLSYTVLE